jgi:hypothetical protein
VAVDGFVGTDGIVHANPGPGLRSVSAKAKGEPPARARARLVAGHPPTHSRAPAPAPRAAHATPPSPVSFALRCL